MRTRIEAAIGRVLPGLTARAPARIHTLTLALTDRCNLRCRMCDIWEKNPGERKELGLEAVASILRARGLRRLGAVNLTGGEPFLREDLRELYCVARVLHPECRFTISSNGTLTGAMVRFFGKIRGAGNITLELSLLGNAAHDAVTRVSGSLRRLKLSVMELRRRFPGLGLKAKFVLTPWNCDDVVDVARACAAWGIPLLVKQIENSRYYTNTLRHGENRRRRAFVIPMGQRRRLLSRFQEPCVAMIVDKGALQGVISSLKGDRTSRPCCVPERSLFIQANGDVHRCRSYAPVGNVHGAGLDDLLARDYQGPGDGCEGCSSIFRLMI